MNKRNLNIAIGLTIAALATAGGYGLYGLGVQRGMQGSTQSGRRGDTQGDKPGIAVAPTAAAQASAASIPAKAVPQSVAEGIEATRRHMATGIKAGDMDPLVGSKVLYYQDPMVPGNRFDKPGKSPFMDMLLVPVYADGSDSESGSGGGSGGGQGGVTVSARTQQNLGVRTAQVTEGVLAPQISAVGSIAFNERDQAVVQARASGYVEHVYVRATLDAVGKGQPLVDLFLPDWVGAQEEFLSLKRMRGNDLGGLVDGARQRMRLLGMTEAQINHVEATGKAQPRITVAAPIAGVLTEVLAREGMTVAPGAPLFRINGLSTVWANAELPESQAALVRPGTPVLASSPAVPGVRIAGKVQALVPDVNAATRTLKARVELANPQARLVPGMTVAVQFMDTQANKVLLVPSEAVIMTGKRSVVLVAEEGDKSGRFRPVEVEVGLESGGQTEIKRGLTQGQRVVVSSQFMIDSEASLKGVEARLNDATLPAPQHNHSAGQQP